MLGHKIDIFHSLIKEHLEKVILHDMGGNYGEIMEMVETLKCCRVPVSAHRGLKAALFFAQPFLQCP